MKIKILLKNKHGKISISQQELQDLLNESYQEGYSEGYSKGSEEIQFETPKYFLSSTATDGIIPI